MSLIKVEQQFDDEPPDHRRYFGKICENVLQRETLLLNILEILGNTFCEHHQQQNK